MSDRGTNQTTGEGPEGTSETTSNEPTGSAGSALGGTADDGPHELSRAAAVGATVLSIACGAVVLLAVFHWLGWAVPGVGWLVAKAGIKLAVGGFAGLAVAAAWLRARFGAQHRS
ncbi:hypothetical protein AB0O91_13410 [Kitasatospora sp. NPDC089797]|uniref:hypothetical protein n=1 Tax=Kitasatospora sp. NPDC089797 TaxID=3155298 RepID=UPI0034161F4C